MENIEPGIPAGETPQLDVLDSSNESVLPRADNAAHIDEQGRLLVPRELTGSEKRMHALYEKKFGRSITTYEVRGHTS